MFLLIALAFETVVAVSFECPDRCRPTCTVPNPEGCSDYSNCNTCESGYIWSEDGDKCIRIEECPYGPGCNGDENASIRERPPPCPSTCSAPDEFPCKKMGLAVGCVCKTGFILSEEGGRCIKPNTCPGGNPCGVNGTFVFCKIDCPSKYCPVEPRQSVIICDPVWPCPTGCVCQHTYLWNSKEDRTCIKSEDCPEIPCTDANEEWVRCPNPCLTDSCSDYNRNVDCASIIEPECRPQCRCKAGFARDSETQTCIPADQCPPVSAPVS